MARYISPRQRATLAVTLLGVIIALDLFLIVSELMQVELLTRIADKAPFTIEEATANDARMRSLAVLHGVAFVVSAVTFLCWFYRAAANAVALRLAPSGFASSAVWGFFIPIMNLFAPYQTMKTLWQGNADGEAPRGGASWILSIWWGFWLGTNVLSNIAMFASKSAGKDVRAMVSATELSSMNHLVAIPAAVLAILAIRGVTARQESLSRSDVADSFD